MVMRETYSQSGGGGYKSGPGVGARAAGYAANQFLFEVGLERFADHVVDDGAGGIERSSFLAGRAGGLGVVLGQQVLEDAPQQFGVERDFLFDRGVLRNREGVAVENAEQTVHLHVALFRAQRVAQVGAFPPAEEQDVGDIRLIVRHVRKTVHAHLVCLAGAGIQAFEEAAVQERDVLKKPAESFRVSEQLLVPVEAVIHVVLVDAAIAPAVAEFALVEGDGQCGEKQVLEDGKIVGCLIFDVWFLIDDIRLVGRVE